MTPLAKLALASAQSQIGIQEFPKGSNAGTDVEKYLKSVGLKKGFAWCMAFVYWAIQQSPPTPEGGVKNPLKKTAGVLDQWNYCKGKGLTVSTPQSGDIFIMDFGKGVGHTGFVEKVLPNGMLQTIEGNTNDDGSREGYKVCRRTRTLATIKGFIRI
jgi:hypothetical protein